MPPNLALLLSRPMLGVGTGLLFSNTGRFGASQQLKRSPRLLPEPGDLSLWGFYLGGGVARSAKPRSVAGVGRDARTLTGGGVRLLKGGRPGERAIVWQGAKWRVGRGGA
mgnify:CR=1 FL=1